ncbi:hypothetical protein RclHR1_16880004 [Rhizophagus clarus]|uniref:Uncharacterized protein n=1 Tax=Rhizophagus clarus TaxID=94130 RepID=A0A2Z6RBI3_9GLOM|nr:hypothetical protein RclHR1_16880004 [Rhizophagus clarus]
MERRVEELLRTLRYKECPKYNDKEKTLIGVVKMIFDECVVNKNIYENSEGVNFILNKIKGANEIVLHGYILNDTELKSRFQIFWEWYTQKTLANRSKGETLMRFKQLLIKEDDIITSRKEVRKYGISKNQLGMKEKKAIQEMEKSNSDEESDDSIERRHKDIEETTNIVENEEINDDDIVRLLNLNFTKYNILNPGFIERYIEVRYNEDEDIKNIMEIWLKEKHYELEHNVEEVGSTGITDEEAIDNIMEILQKEKISIEKEDVIRVLNLEFGRYLILDKEFIGKYQEIKEKSDEEIKTELEEWWIRKMNSENQYKEVSDNEEEAREILEQVKETMLIATLEEIRRLLNWGYTESEVLDNEIILEYRKMKMELDPFDDEDERSKGTIKHLCSKEESSEKKRNN